MKQNNTAKYFKYAIGEIVLVVIGILIALQINTWNQNRLTKNEEFNALHNLREDFIKNQELLKVTIDKSKDGITSCLKILSYTGFKDKPANERIFDSILNKIFISPFYYPVNGTLDELINSGKLTLISNEELRKLISLWHPHLQTIREQYKELEESELYFNQYMISNGSWLNADQVTTINRTIELPPSGFSKDNRDLLDELKFENLVENTAIGLDNYLMDLNETSRILNDIVESLNNAIGKFDD